MSIPTTSTLLKVEEMSPISPQEDGIGQPAKADESEGDDDEEAKGLSVRDGHHQHKLEDVHQLVEGALNTIDHTALSLHHHLQEQLSDGQVCHPQTYIIRVTSLVQSFNTT